MDTERELAVPAVVEIPARAEAPPTALRQWLLAHEVQPVGPEAGEGHTPPQPW